MPCLESFDSGVAEVLVNELGAVDVLLVLARQLYRESGLGYGVRVLATVSAIAGDLDGLPEVLIWKLIAVWFGLIQQFTEDVLE